MIAFFIWEGSAWRRPWRWINRARGTRGGRVRVTTISHQDFSTCAPCLCAAVIGPFPSPLTCSRGYRWPNGTSRSGVWRVTHGRLKPYCCKIVEGFRLEPVDKVPKTHELPEKTRYLHTSGIKYPCIGGGHFETGIQFHTRFKHWINMSLIKLYFYERNLYLFKFLSLLNELMTQLYV